MNVLKKVGIGAGYVLFFVLCTVLFVRFLFPTRQAKEFAALKLAEATGAETVTIRDLGITGLIPSGVEIDGLEMTLPGVKMKTTERNGSVIGPKRRVSVEKVTADVESISGLLNGAPDVTFDLAMGGGTLEGGHYKREKDGPHTLKIDKIDGIALGPEQLFQTLVGMDIQGVFSGNVDLTIPTEQRDGKEVMAFDHMSGTVELTLAHAIALEPIIEMAGAREKLTDIELGDVHIKLVAEANPQASPTPAAQTGDAKTTRPPSRRGDGTIVTLEDASALGGDISVASQKGSLTFTQGAGPKDARLNIHLAVKPEESFYNKEVEDPNDPTKKTTPNKRLKTGIELGMKNKLVDGQIGVAITGTVGEPKVTTEKPRTRVGSSGGAAASTRKMNVDQPGGEEPTDGDGEAKPKDVEKPRTKPPNRADREATEGRRQPPANGRPMNIARPASNRPTPVAPSIPTEPVPVEPEHIEPEPPLDPADPTQPLDPNAPEHDPNAPAVEGVPGEELPVDPNAPIEEPLPQ